MRRHFTVSGFVVEGDGTLLHWHKKLQIWLPPGGHIDPDEDPVQAVVREVLEETGIAAEVVPHESEHAFSNLPQLASPLSIIVADVGAAADEPAHQHIDMCYALQPLVGVARVAPEADHGFVLVSAERLRREERLAVASCGVDMPVAEDVRVLALRSIELVRAAGNRTGLQPTTRSL
jgi:8-oxo-dGTP pyrophosphatase MutT (NUDIX family)